MSGRHPDQGFTLIEVLLVILVLGLMTAVVVSATGRFTSNATDSGCVADWRNLTTATERYFAEMQTNTIAAANGTPDGFEQTLISLGYLKTASSMHDLTANGRLVAASQSPCTVATA
jgi:prepilin-type N-terminal cleavage/methylation domain-containing protein